MAVQMVRQRVDSPDRWQKALNRALAHNLTYLELLGGDGAWAVSSTRDDEQGYIATVATCTCPAGRGGDPVCCHRALVRALTGVMPVDAPADCPNCCGCGVQTYRTFEERCPSCGGSGVKPDRRLRDAPPVQPMATAA